MSSSSSEIIDVSTSKAIPQLSLLSSTITLPTSFIDATAEENIPVIKIVFPDGTEDVTVLKHHNPLGSFKGWNPTLACTYMGSLKSEPEATVAVTGCIRQPKDKMYITLISQRSRFHKSFSIDGEGNVKFIKVTTKPGDNEVQHNELRISDLTIENPSDDNDDELFDDTVEEQAAHVHLGELENVPTYVAIRIKIVYDTSFRNFFSTDDETNNFIADVMNHVQAHYLEMTLRHNIYWDVEGDIIAYPDVLTIGGDPSGLDQATAWVAANGDPNIGLYLFFSDTPQGSGVTGRAWVGQVCASGGYKVSITRGPSRGVIEMSETLSHEVGHNLGMSHDFDQAKSSDACRKTDDGATIPCSLCSSLNCGHSGDNMQCCTGYLDYYDHPQCWSGCSVRFFEEHYVALNWQRPECARPVSERGAVSPIVTRVHNGYRDCLNPIFTLDVTGTEFSCEDFDSLPAAKCDKKLSKGLKLLNPTLNSQIDANTDVSLSQLCPYTLKDICTATDRIPVCLAPTNAPTNPPTPAPTPSPTAAVSGTCDTPENMNPGDGIGSAEYWVGYAWTIEECEKLARGVTLRRNGKLIKSNGITVASCFPAAQGTYNQCAYCWAEFEMTDIETCCGLTNYKTCYLE